MCKAVFYLMGDKNGIASKEQIIYRALQAIIKTFYFSQREWRASEELDKGKWHNQTIILKL